MKPFDIITIDGYDLVASAEVVEGGGPYSHAIVLNNNSSVYIVAMRSMDAPTASVRSLWPYTNTDTERAVHYAYINALDDMVRYALTH